MSKDKAIDKYYDLKDKLRGEVTVIMLDGAVVGRIIGRWYDSHTGLVFQAGIELEGMIKNSEGNTERFYYVTKAGGGGYNKCTYCMGALFSNAETFIEGNYGLEIKYPNMYCRNTDGRKSIDWSNGWREILKKTGFTVIEAL